MFDTATLLWGLVFGSVGYVYFSYGGKRANIVTRYSGVALMVCPYFVQSSLALVLLGIGLMLIPKFVKV